MGTSLPGAAESLPLCSGIRSSWGQSLGGSSHERNGRRCPRKDRPSTGLLKMLATDQDGDVGMAHSGAALSQERHSLLKGGRQTARDRKGGRIGPSHGGLENTGTGVQQTCIQILAPPFASCVALGQ